MSRVQARYLYAALLAGACASRPPAAEPSRPSDAMTEGERERKREKAPPPLRVPPPSYGRRIVLHGEAVSHAPADVASNAVDGQDGEHDPSCVETWPEVRYRNYGYDHIIHLYSRCDVLAYCSVATDVNPAPQAVSVPPRAHVEVLTFRGSPARQFTPNVKCRFR